MKILQNNLVTAVSSGAGNLSSTYAIANVENDTVALPYIANATSAALTINVGAGMNCFFISGHLCDSGTISISASPGSSASIALNASQYSDLDQLAINTRHRLPPEWFNFTVSGSSITRVDTGSALAAATITLTLNTATDRKDSPVSGNAIHQWDQSSGAVGRFEDSSGNGINLNDFGNVMIGSICTIGGSDYQVIKIVGNGSGSTDVTLSGSASDATVTAIKNPVKVGIVRAGSVLSVENPQIGTGLGFNDYSIRRQIVDGGLSFKQRNLCKQYSVSSIMTDSNAQSFEAFYRSFRSKPFPALVTQNMPASTNSDTRNSGFFYFIAPPSFEYIQHQGAVSAISFDIHEVI
jgi:hypothetical protein